MRPGSNYYYLILINIFVFESSLSVENNCVAVMFVETVIKKSGFLKVFCNLLSLLLLQIKSY